MRISYDFVSLVIAVRTGVLLNTLNLELMAWGGEYGFISLLLFSTASRAEVLTPHSSRSFLLSSSSPEEEINVESFQLCY